MPTTAHQPSTPALVEQQHLCDEIEHQDTELAFEAIAAKYAPAATPDELAAFQAVLDARAATRRRPAA